MHQFTPDRKLWLGGIVVPSERGLLGHSDADVLIHALCDAILGALSLGDIGKHFPDNSQEFKGIDSCILLSKVMDLAKERGYRLGNADITIALQAPKLASFIPSMRENLSSICGCEPDRISVKATTTEKLGFVGRREGCEVWATVLMLK